MGSVLNDNGQQIRTFAKGGLSNLKLQQQLNALEKRMTELFRSELQETIEAKVEEKLAQHVEVQVTPPTPKSDAYSFGDDAEIRQHGSGLKIETGADGLVYTNKSDNVHGKFVTLNAKFPWVCTATDLGFGIFPKVDGGSVYSIMSADQNNTLVEYIPHNDKLKQIKRCYGGQHFPTAVRVTGDYNVQNAEFLVACSPVHSEVVITLPDTKNQEGRCLHIKDISGRCNDGCKIHVKPFVKTTRIDDGHEYVMYDAYESVTLYCMDNHWYIL